MKLIESGYKAIAPYGLSLPSMRATIFLVGSLAVIHTLAALALNRLTTPEIRESDFRRDQSAPQAALVTEETGSRLDKIRTVKTLYSFTVAASVALPISMNPKYLAFYAVSLVLFASLFSAPMLDSLLKKLPLSAGDMNLLAENKPIADNQRFEAAYQPPAAGLRRRAPA